MRFQKMKIGVLILLSWAATVSTDVECGTVTGLLSVCSTFISYGSPDPLPGSPCCNAMISLRLIAESGDNRRSVCRCFMGLIAAYNPLGTAVATLPGLCGINLGFVVYPNTDCTS
ncbi:hypothetical protein P3X46_030605 [Hevea brasiliensis]|uniref:Bifunctional inhibitor/plant lipid transfer protein/seed storage helical domain-containing protein n=2 Tax=Hevea brasiliensis TaxID=3981 RepID=A0ABQ9KHQ8_HEVBR|nr:hypothetical protein P3X46_030605 [Hevea brasiliensis]